MKNKLFYLALIVITCTAFVYSCSKGNSSPMGNTAAGASVSIQNFSFAPDTVRITTGSTVTWTNMDSTPHTVTSLTSVFDSGNLASGGVFKFSFPIAGTFTYHCLIHSMMKTAVVVVK